MNEELLKVLNVKLESVNNNIDALNNINGMLDREYENLDYVEKILGIFDDGRNQYDIIKFSGLKREDFDKVMTLMPSDVSSKFSTTSCNYDGLIYLIDGINNGISLALTEEQEDAIKYMLNGVNDKKMEYIAKIEGIKLAKGDLEETNMDVLEEKQDIYYKIVDELDNNKYVSQVDEVLDAIEYSEVNSDSKAEMLSALLKYNAEIYDEHSIDDELEEEENVSFHDPEVSNIEVNEEVEEPVEEEKEEEEETPEEETPEDNSFDLPTADTMDFTDLVANNIEMPTEVEEEKEEETSEEEPEIDIEIPEQVMNGLMDDVEAEAKAETEPENSVEIPVTPIPEEPQEVKQENLLDEQELRKTLEDYHIKYDDIVNKEDLLKGDIENYKDILNIFKDNDLLSDVTKNEVFLKDLLCCSDKEVVNIVLDIIKKDFSIDEEDFYETARITIDSMPSIFVKEDKGNYENFVKNVDFFKGLNFDLISLFDFSREILLVDNNLLKKNCDLVSRYDVRLEPKNAKYLLALKDSVERIDYYVEAVYLDTITNKTFDGMNIVKTYPSKLDTVTDLTIKRLRYSSENGKKIFGSRENSIAGEIANLKVDVLNIPDDFFMRFFNNEFNDITNEEVKSYVDLINNNTNYEFNDNSVLSELNKYRNGNRYNIAGINISYNKVLRNYNILINNNIDKDKALEFAVCYNLVCTKEEYENVLNELKAIGGK